MCKTEAQLHVQVVVAAQYKPRHGGGHCICEQFLTLGHIGVFSIVGFFPILFFCNQNKGLQEGAMGGRKR